MYMTFIKTTNQKHIIDTHKIKGIQTNHDRKSSTHKRKEQEKKGTEKNNKIKKTRKQ